MKILLTGITGIVGWNFWKFSIREKNEHELLAISNKNYPELNKFKEKIFNIPITDFESIRQKVNEVSPDVIVHTAGICDLDVCETRIKDTHLINVEGTKRLLEGAVRAGAKHFIYISSDHVFSGKNPPYQEEDMTDPISIYGESRVKAEEAVKKSLLPWTILRCSLPIGRSLQGNTGPHDWFCSRTFNEKQADYFEDEVRNAVFASDIAKAIWQVIENRNTGIFHIGGSQGMNRFHLAQIFSEVYPGTFSFIRSRYRKDEKDGPPRIGDVTMRFEKAEQALNFKPQPVTAENIRLKL